MGSSRIGVYSICYKEAEWLSFQLARMYDWVDAFSICVGPVKHLMGEERDIETAEALRGLPDPDGKITVAEGVWEDKNHMTSVATEALDTPIILQLDSDEVWPKQAFDEAIALLESGKRKLLLHMYSFWKTSEHVMEIPDRFGWAAKKLGVSAQLLHEAARNEPGAEVKVRKHLCGSMLPKQKVLDTLRVVFEGVEAALDGGKENLTLAAYDCIEHPWTPYLLDMHRAFRPCAHTRITHIPPNLAWPNGESAHWQDAGVVPTPLWHLCYIGDERMARKSAFFNKRAGMQVMPAAAFFEKWVPAWGIPHGVDELTRLVMALSPTQPRSWRMTGQLRTVARYDGPPIPEEVVQFAERMI